MSDEKKNMTVGSFDKKILGLPKKWFFVLIAILLVAVLAGGAYFAWKEYISDSEPDLGLGYETVVFEGEEYKVPNYISEAQDQDDTEPNPQTNREAIDIIEKKIAAEGASVDYFGTNDFTVLAQLYYAEGDVDGSIEYYKKSIEFMRLDTSSDNSDQIAFIESIVSDLEQEADN